MRRRRCLWPEDHQHTNQFLNEMKEQTAYIGRVIIIQGEGVKSSAAAAGPSSSAAAKCALTDAQKEQLLVEAALAESAAEAADPKG